MSGFLGVENEPCWVVEEPFAGKTIVVAVCARRSDAEGLATIPPLTAGAGPRTVVPGAMVGAVTHDRIVVDVARGVVVPETRR